MFVLTAGGSAPSHEASIIVSLLVVLASASVVTLLLQRARMAAIPAYLITGMLIGPYALGMVRSYQNLTEISHLAIILLLFGIGLNLELSSLRHSLVRMVIAGVGSCVLTVTAGWYIVKLFNLPSPVALTISMGLALSSTAVVLRIITDRRELRHVHGRLSIAILVMQDMIVLVMLAALPILSTWAGMYGDVTVAGSVSSSVSIHWSRFIVEGVLRIGGIALLIAMGRLVLPRLMHESVRGGSLEVLMIVGIAVALAAAILAQTLGFSLEMGAFLAGLILSGTLFRHQLTGQIGPLRNLFIAVFFTTVGMKVNPAILIQWWWVVLLATAIMIIVKTLLIAGSCWAIGATAGTAFAVGCSLFQAGEFSLVFFDAANREGLLSDAVTAFLIATIVLSLVLTPALDRLGRKIRHSLSGIGSAPWLSRIAFFETDDSVIQEETSTGRVIIGGYGPAGRLIAENLEEAGIGYTVIDLNPGTVHGHSKRGKSFVFGDISNPEVLESAGIALAETLILTIPDERAVIRSCEFARRIAPDIFIVARISHASRKTEAEASGADLVIVEELATAESILSEVVNRIIAKKPPENDNTLTP